jgi:ribonucleoside-diphosphate reductase alpha chain
VFPAWLGSRWEKAGRKLRNATTTTVAPTGTISIIAGCSSGIEPLYAVAYQRHVLDGAVLTEVNPAFRRAAEAAGAWTEATAAEVTRTGRARGSAGVPDDVARRFPTAHDVDVAWHVKMQAAWQRHVHAAVSKTINLRHDATPDDVRTAYQLAYRLGCKGITVYRDGSREGQVLTSGQRDPHEGERREACPECGGELVVHARCSLCRACGWSVCG